MRIIITGMGDVGYQLAKQLSSESHDIIAIDQSQEYLMQNISIPKQVLILQNLV